MKNDRPFAFGAAILSFYLTIIAFATIPIFKSPFITGSILTFNWALWAYGWGLDLIGDTQQARAGKSAFGLFMIIVGITLAAIGPNYLNTGAMTTEWFVMWGLFLGGQVGEVDKTL